MLKKIRERTIQVMHALRTFNLEAKAHGSIARGDVNKNSDIDIFIPSQQSSFIIETALEKACLSVNRRFVIQATPIYAMKAYLEIDESLSISFPLMKMRKVEREFYKFSGEIKHKDLEKGVRVCGVNKRLMLVEPTEKGHEESTIIGFEGHVASLLGISVETVLDRVRALLKRDEIGRTGNFIKKELSSYETFEMALKRLADVNPAVRRRLKSIT